ncbi:tryptophan-rich sensory protein [Kocuria massiliensis]|uniref:tryptophan-rich sensory protein n=1 Tax=Kocuria massiliensis TaxID=1926282 RepID=UPI0022B947BD|nr:tryptophan-rich sensory protein [Kocuria massiliensis]
MNTDNESARRALVTGATGYIGGQVTAELLRRGWAVRTLSRDRGKAESMPWGDQIVPRGARADAGQVEVYEGDASSAEDLRAALSGVDIAWYLIHSMSETSGFRAEEVRMAKAFAHAAEEGDVGRIVYLGGLHPEGESLSEHLASRVEVGEVLMASRVPTAVLQAGVVIGEGSSSFEMLRHLSERLPGAIAPRWIRHRITPISVRDAVYFLASAADLPAGTNREFDVGGPDTMEYAEMMKAYARVAGLPPRWVATAPVTTPRLASYWVSLVTPVSRTLSQPLIGSLLHHTELKERDLEAAVGTPAGGLQSFDTALGEALRGIDPRRWRRTAAGVGGAVVTCGIVGSLLVQPDNPWYRRLDLPSWQPPAAVFPVVWSGLYADIAVVESLVMADQREQGNHRAVRSSALALGVNLALNAGWCGLFFRSKRPRLSTAWAALLAASSADLVRRAWKSSPERGVLLAPYAAWTSFATFLNGAVAARN